jgi:hypothetical protein
MPRRAGVLPLRPLLLALAVAGCATPAPTVPPTAANAAPARTVALVNPGFESTAPGRRGDPEGWFTFQHAGDKSYLFTLDTTQPRSGARSLRIDNTGPEPYGSVAQAIEAAPHAGKVARYSAWLRTRDVSETGAVLTLVAMQSGVPMAQNFMADKPVRGTTGWTRYTIVLPIEKGAERIEVGAMMQGKGSLWLDDAELEFVDP